MRPPFKHRFHPHRGHGGPPGGGKPNRPGDQTLQEIRYLKYLIEKQTPVRIKLRNNEEVDGFIEYYDHSFVRLTRANGPNLFIFKHEIKYLYEKEGGRGGAVPRRGTEAGRVESGLPRAEGFDAGGAEDRGGAALRRGTEAGRAEAGLRRPEGFDARGADGVRGGVTPRRGAETSRTGAVGGQGGRAVSGQRRAEGSDAERTEGVRAEATPGEKGSDADPNPPQEP